MNCKENTADWGLLWITTALYEVSPDCISCWVGWSDGSTTTVYNTT